MAALVCDICGGKLVMGAGGIAVCDSCGMEHGADRMREKIQEIKGTVRVDNSHMIDNYLEMANNAHDASNNAEAESYCNKIIEIDPTNYKAWFLKGKAAGWQSTIQNSRVPESVAAFSKAIMNAPEEEKEEIVEQAKEQITNLSKALISLRGERFAKWPDEEEARGFSSDLSSILDTLEQFASQAGVVISVSELMAPIAEMIHSSVLEAYTEVIWPEYAMPDDPDDRANKYEWQRYIERIGYCTALLDSAIGLCDEDDEEDIERYNTLVLLHDHAIDSCSWDYNFTDWGKSWHKEYELADSAKSARRKLIKEYKAKIQTIKNAKERKAREEAQKRFDAYWAEHADEKATLETEKNNLEGLISELQEEIKNIPGDAEKKDIQKRIDALTAEKDSLGLFKAKEKKALQEKIDAEYAELKKVGDRMSAAKKEIEKKINPLQQRVNKIKSELTKER